MERRTFLAALGVGAAATQFPLLGAEPAPAGRVTLLHTNDTHSHIEPFGPGNGAFSGKGGMARRATLVKNLREQLGAVLLLDAGDVFQGTPYFNQYKGHLDYQLMSMMGYDAGTLGNHDFDNGVEGLVSAMEEAKFPFVNCNFDLTGAPKLAKHVQTYIIKQFPGVKVGITGVGINFRGLVTDKNHEGVVWHEPVAALKPVVKRLREVEKVDLVVVLSHLGFDATAPNISDQELARLVPGIDAIIGGHSHTFLAEPLAVKTEHGTTLVAQVGFGGINLGRIDYTVSKGGVKAGTGSALPVHQRG
jgi:5'-nucleotidase